MRHSPRRRPPRPGRSQPSGRLLFGAGALVVAALVLVPWLVAQVAPGPVAPALAAFLALLPALYFWFRRMQRTTGRTAVLLALAYAAVAAGVLWLWRAP